MRSEEAPTRFKETQGLNRILNRVQELSYPKIFEEFEKWPILEIRQACLKQMKERKLETAWLVKWTETCVRELSYYEDKMANEVLSWYVFASSHESLSVRAIEFALTMKESMGLNFISKIVCGRICQKPFLYPMLPSLPVFLNELLNELKPYRCCEKKEYNFWHYAERALKMIMTGKDYSFLPKISGLIALLQSGVVFPSRFEPPYTKDLHLAILEATRKILKKAQREALKSKEV